MCLVLNEVAVLTGKALINTFNNISVISWRSILLVVETGVPRENPVAFIYIQVERKYLTEIISYICSSLSVSLTLIDNLFRWIKHIIINVDPPPPK
jgi:hypothetical protein